MKAKVFDIKTLYITDLDGTLLSSDGILSKTSYEILQPMINDGLGFVIATGRTRDNALSSIQPLKLTLPLICDNGTFIYDSIKKTFFKKNFFKRNTIIEIINTEIKNGVLPFVNTLNKNQIHVFHSKLYNFAVKSFYEDRSKMGLSEYTQDDFYKDYQNKQIFNVSVLDTYENLIELYNKFIKIVEVTVLMFPSHYYKGFYWLEILPQNSGKGQAIDFLKNLYNPEKIVCFGDNLNDLCMFERADVKIAPQNAVSEVCNAADIIIDSCDKDSVAKYIRKHFV